MTTATAGTHLLADILRHPKDDTPRRIYSDWLRDHDEWTWPVLLDLLYDYPDSDGLRLLAADWFAEQGTPDGEARKWIIRDMTKHKCEYDIRPWMLPMLHQANPSAECGHPVPCPQFDYQETRYIVRRGFIAEVRCPIAIWLQHGPDIAAQHPVQTVQLTDREPLLSPGRYEWCDCYTYNDHSFAASRHRLPSNLSRIFHPCFPTIKEAHAWASQRAILWARGKLGGAA